MASTLVNTRRKSRDTVGNVNIPVGYDLEKAPHLQSSVIRDFQDKIDDTSREKQVTKLTRNTGRGTNNVGALSMTNANNTTIQTENRELQKFVQMLEFEQRTDKMIIVNKIREFVERGMMAHEEDINIRREKLRDMLAAEEAQLIEEVVNQLRITEEMKQNEMRAREEEKRIEEERKNKLLITTKMRQHHLENSHETRERISRDLTRGVKYSNLIQMMEKLGKKEEEKKLDELWYRIMMKENENQRRRDYEENRKRWISGKETGLVLEKQIADRTNLSGQLQRLNDEKLELERLWDEVRAEEVRTLMKEKEKREKLRKDLEEQLKVGKERMKEQARQQTEFDEMLRIKNISELAKEREAIAKNNEYLRREMLAYMASLDELKREEARREAEVNEIIDKSAKGLQERRDLATKRYNEERKRIFHNVMNQRDEQLRMKREDEENEKKRMEIEVNLLRKNTEIETAESQAAALRKREMALNYRRELLAQRHYDEEKKRRSTKNDKNFCSRTMMDNEEFQRFTDEFTNAPDIITTSSFKSAVKEYEARRDSQQKMNSVHRSVLH